MGGGRHDVTISYEAMVFLVLARELAELDLGEDKHKCMEVFVHRNNQRFNNIRFLVIYESRAHFISTMHLILWSRRHELKL